jgi:hypothetical protein
LWSCKLTAEGEAVVARYCAERGIKDPVAAVRERQDGELMLDSAELMQTSLESSDDFIEWIVDEYTKNKQFFAKAREQ